VGDFLGNALNKSIGPVVNYHRDEIKLVPNYSMIDFQLGLHVSRACIDS
jgi:hypothetical protein